MRLTDSPKYLRLGYALGLLLIATLSSVIWITSVRVIDAQESVAAEVNVSGRQRMLSQRIAWLAERLDGAEADARDGLREEIAACADFMGRAHQALLSRDTERVRASAAEGVECRPGAGAHGAPGEMSETISALFFAEEPPLDHVIRSFVEAAREVASPESDGTVIAAALSRIGDIANDILPGKLDALTYALQREGEGRIKTLMIFKTAMWAATLVLLVLEVVFIFRPLEIGVRRSLEDLRRTVQSLRERERANALLRGENEAKTRFLAHMSHEFRTPLNAIIGFAEFLCAADKMNLPKEKREEYSSDIRQAGRHMLSLVDDILDLARIDADVLKPEPSRSDVAEVVRSAISMVRPIARDAEVEIDSSELVPPEHALWADPRMARQVLVNLLTNAVKYNRPKGWVRMTVEALDYGAVRFTITDNGVGMSPEAVPGALEPFNRADRDPAIASDGVGLGLALCKRIVDLHNGTLTLESVLDGGTTVTVVFPGAGDNVVPIRATG